MRNDGKANLGKQRWYSYIFDVPYKVALSETMRNYFVENYDTYIKRATDLKDRVKGTIILDPLFAGKANVACDAILEKLTQVSISLAIAHYVATCRHHLWKMGQGSYPRKARRNRQRNHSYHHNHNYANGYKHNNNDYTRERDTPQRTQNSEDNKLGKAHHPQRLRYRSKVPPYQYSRS